MSIPEVVHQHFSASSFSPWHPDFRSGQTPIVAFCKTQKSSMYCLLTHHITEKALKALVLQKAYGRDLMTSITALQNRSQDLRRAATACHHSVNVQSNLLNRETYKATQDTRAVVREISAHGSVVIDELHEIREELRDSRDSGKAVVAADALNSQLELLKGDLIAAVEQSLCE